MRRDGEAGRGVLSSARRGQPGAQTELAYRDPYTLLVAVILSAQATDVSVNKATEPLFKVANTPAAMIALGEDRLIPYIRTIGLFRNKAKAVIAMSRRLLEAHGGEVPNDRDALQSSQASAQDRERGAEFGIRSSDHRGRHARVSGRQSHRLAPGKTPVEVERGLEAGAGSTPSTPITG